VDAERGFADHTGSMNQTPANSEHRRARRAWVLATVPLLWASLALIAPADPQQPPAQAVGGASTCMAPGAAPAASSAAYVRSSQADLINLLPPPPEDRSAAARADLQAVLDAQHAAHERHLVEHAVGDAQTSCARFSDVVGAALTEAPNAPVLAFLNRAAQDGAAMTGPVKQYWHRLRPYALSEQVERLADVSPDAPLAVTARSACGPNVQLPSREVAAQALARVSYPSGHSAFGTVCAILLADMVPEKRAELFDRGRDYGHSRLVVGAHFPTDVEAGRTVGTVAVALMMENAQFERDYGEARARLRSALGLPAAH
jgi:acid phosphatase (class A)